MKWGFASIRAIAACEVFLLATAVDRIVLGRKYGFDSWLLDALVEVCERTDSLSLLEACRMSVEDYVRISQAREAIRLPGAHMDAAHVRAVVARMFGLSDGGIAPEETSISTRTLPVVVDESNQAQPFANGDKFIVGGEHDHPIGHCSYLYNTLFQTSLPSKSAPRSAKFKFIPDGSCVFLYDLQCSTLLMK